MGHTAAEPEAATEGSVDAISLPQISARIGSVNDGRLERRPRKLSREVELRGVAKGLPLPLVDAKGHPSLLGVPAVVKSFSKGSLSKPVCIRGTVVGPSANGPLHILTSGSTADPRRLAAATSACLRATARPLRSTSSHCANCSTRFKCIRGCSSPTRSRSCRKVR